MALAAFLAASVSAAEIGQIKVSNGQVTVERKGEALPGQRRHCGSRRPTC